MLEYAKKILSKVSFDKHLFKRELHKFLQNTTDENQKSELKNWVRGEFNHQHPETIRDAFDNNQRQPIA